MRAAWTRVRRYGEAHPQLLDGVVSWRVVLGVVLAARYDYASHGRVSGFPACCSPPPPSCRSRCAAGRR
ncbi:hypothetical protein [Amycolatopsis sp. NPDC003861]